ncbi:alpha/beta fold hydrolase [Aeromicrobium ginsengisoli]|uniref:Alpha/beta hydrolase n=1 Tax=Aeromicrobium ginsengisoli TaxID=363867 RepID=A0A5M4FG19_9ACTN|nr:alpha/beta hydrolase [Aeromicrobium ginsengisoli]KAA1397811.1 alpha/beta hydrolase [Aeromicrobium ginsengisoli]
MPRSDWQEVTVTSNGQRIHLRVSGDSGPLVLLCHGFPESSYAWHHQLDALGAAGYRAVAMDMPGYGRSAKLQQPSDYRITELVAYCVGVVEALGESTAVIVGHDFGAPVAWASAWTRPDVFRAVVGMSVPFGARGLAALPGDPFGDVRPTLTHRELAGPGLTFYQDYFADRSGKAEKEIEQDLRTFITSGFYGLSADSPLPPELNGVDLTSLPPEHVIGFVRAAMCVPDGEGFAVNLQSPETLPGWLDHETLDIFIAELEFGGMRSPLAWYTNADLNWEVLAQYQGQPLTVPAMFIGGDRDVATIWSQEARLRAAEYIPDLRGSVIIPNCGHWIQQEHPETVNQELLTFLKGL